MYGWKLAERTFINKRTVREKYVLDPVETLDHTTYLTAYKGAKSNATSFTGNPSMATTELSDTEYVNIRTDNGVYIHTSASATTEFRYAETAHRFRFDLRRFVTLPYIVYSIEYGWDGYCSEEIGGLMRRTPAGWETKLSPLPTSDGSGLEFTETITKMIGALVDGYFEFGVQANKGYIDSPVTIDLYTDYVYVTVTYRITDLINTPVIQPKVIGVSGYER